MLAKVRITTVLLLTLLPVAFLPGCGGNSSNVDSAGGGQSLNLSLTTPDGTTALIADGNSSTQIQMTVTNQDGQPLVNKSVRFSTDAGALFPVSGTNVISTSAAPRAATRQTGGSSSITVGTNTQGIAQVQLTSSTNVGTATVTAEVEGFRQAFSINFISGIPSQLTVSVSPSIVGVGQTATVEALVVDSDNQPLVGVDVTFTLSSTDSGASISPATRTTDATGSARVTYTAGANPGTDTIQAQLAASTSADAATLAQSTSVTVQDTGTAANNIQLLVSSPQMDSDGLEAVTLTALVRDDNNNFISGADVMFAADTGGIQVINGTTDAAGAATAMLSTAGDPSNRTIRVEAFVTGLSSSANFVEVSGTTITLNGPSSLVLGESATLSLLLQDSGGNGIAQQTVTLTSNQGNTITPTSVTTDFKGQATVDVTADVGNPDTITAAALGATGSISLIVSTAEFTFLAPTPENREIDLGDLETITIRWLEAGVPQVGETIDFYVTRGTLTATSAVTDANGQASTQVSSSNAGPAVITAEAPEDGGPSAQISIEFVATSADSLILRANPTSLSVNLPDNNDQQSIITAVVRDANDNLVKNQKVSFTLEDTSGGSIFPPSADTDSFGRASTVYTAGLTPSSQDGVIVVARVGTTSCNPADSIPSGPCDQVIFTVAQRSLFVTLGTSHLLTAPTSTQYAKPYTVLVTDANSNPIANATVELNIYPTRYQKGRYIHVFDDSDQCIGWGKPPVIITCDNEDIDRNGILNPGEDFNNNGVLDPTNVAEVPTTVITDATGFAFFDVLYAREFTWVEVELEARTTVAGSEGASKAKFFLPGLEDDFNDCDVAPPGSVSPEGEAPTCSCDETVDPSCPTPTP